MQGYELLGSPSDADNAWETVGPKPRKARRRRRQRQVRVAACGFAAGAPWGLFVCTASWQRLDPGTLPSTTRLQEAASEGEEQRSEGSSAGSVTHRRTGSGGIEQEQEMLSPTESLRSPRDLDLLGGAAPAAASPAVGSCASRPPAGDVPSPFSQPQQQGTSRLQQQQQQPQSRQQEMDAASHRTGAGATPLRSSKSDVASLSVQTARSSTRAQRPGGAAGGTPAGGAGLDGIAEGPSGRAAPSSGSPMAAAAVSAARRASAALAAAAPVQPFSSYLAAELRPGPSYPTADVVWGQTERDRVYNALVAVPFQLERLLAFGVALCLDSFLVSLQ